MLDPYPYWEKQHQDSLDRAEETQKEEESQRAINFDNYAANDPEGYGVGFSDNAQELMGSIVELVLKRQSNQKDRPTDAQIAQAAIALVTEAQNEYIHGA